jgi:hypothetical protein
MELRGQVLEQEAEGIVDRFGSDEMVVIKDEQELM